MFIVIEIYTKIYSSYNKQLVKQNFMGKYTLLNKRVYNCYGSCFTLSLAAVSHIKETFSLTIGNVTDNFIKIFHYEKFYIIS